MLLLLLPIAPPAQACVVVGRSLAGYVVAEGSSSHTVLSPPDAATARLKVSYNSAGTRNATGLGVLIRPPCQYFIYTVYRCVTLLYGGEEAGYAWL